MQFNIQMNNQYNMMENIPNYNKPIVTSSHNFSGKEIEELKNFIVKAVSKYDDYGDIAQSIEEDCEKLCDGIWIVVVGVRDKTNSYGRRIKSLGVNIAQYKIIILLN